ncbi:hypothetical protein GCM10010429_36040 [Micromonospora olivasterospora]|uniref:Integral membrane protein n=1 Tax=Micromonospora olivasterospora TaxID=1880 RepID=A0A562IGK0_MICOL|nr:hypothetical protein JD77_04738 [Micromonospora olivasterospora]
MHGVSGASADKILDHPIVVRVAGDRHAGFYRPRAGTGAAGGAVPGVAVEAYRWGALTAGAAVRTASMLLLLPFMLGNLAVWLRPTPADRFGLLGALCRVLAGSLTVSFVLGIVGVTMNLVGWQCVPYVQCRADRPWLSWLATLPMGPRLALLSLIPLLALRLFWAIGARSAQAFEGFNPDAVPARTGLGRPSPQRRATYRRAVGRTTAGRPDPRTARLGAEGTSGPAGAGEAPAGSMCAPTPGSTGAAGPRARQARLRHASAIPPAAPPLPRHDRRRMDRHRSDRPKTVRSGPGRAGRPRHPPGHPVAGNTGAADHVAGRLPPVASGNRAADDRHTGRSRR